ncbi:hypothetical protein EhV18_00153 [Emiliania huxleyi virus 18]|nr:hypothetical protein EhV18_00153 [Emiliania huxleyi virus 18]
MSEIYSSKLLKIITDKTLTDAERQRNAIGIIRKSPSHVKEPFKHDYNCIALVIRALIDKLNVDSTTATENPKAPAVDLYNAKNGYVKENISWVCTEFTRVKCKEGIYMPGWLKIIISLGLNPFEVELSNDACIAENLATLENYLGWGDHGGVLLHPYFTYIVNYHSKCFFKSPIGFHNENVVSGPGAVNYDEVSKRLK